MSRANRSSKPLSHYEEGHIWAVIIGDGPPGRYLFAPFIEIEGEGRSETTTFPPDYLEHPKGGPFQFILPIPIANVPLSYSMVIVVDGEELCRFPIDLS